MTRASTGASSNGRREPATARRGHLVPAELHRRARRAKALAAAGAKTTWSDVLAEGVGRLVEHADVASLVDSLPRAETATKLVQANLPIELDQRLIELHLDLNDEPGPRVTYEELWAAAIELWLTG